MSVPTPARLVSKDNAAAIVQLDQSLVDAILRLSSLGLRSAALIDYCEAVASGETPVAGVSNGAKPLVIQAYSFLSDKSICVGKFGMGLAEAAEAMELIKRDPEAGRAAVQQAVHAYQSRKGSPKPITVTLEGMPSGRGGSRAGGDGGKAELSELMRRHQALAGAYKFAAKEHGPDGPERFLVRLGGNLAVVGQNKAVALKAASLVRVLGRRHQTLAKYVRLYVPGRSLMSSDKIPDDVYNGIIAPDEVMPADEKQGTSKAG